MNGSVLIAARAANFLEYHQRIKKNYTSNLKLSLGMD